MIKAWLKQVLSALQWDAGARSVAAISPAGDLIDSAGMPALAGLLHYVARWKASGWASSVNALMAAAHAAGGGAVWVPAPASAGQVYVAEREILNEYDNVWLILGPGVWIQRAPSWTATGTLAVGATAVTLTSGSTAAMTVGFYGSLFVDGAGVPNGTTVGSVTNSTVFSLTKPATAAGTVTLTFHPGHNVYRMEDATHGGILAPFGTATIDGNAVDKPPVLEAADVDSIGNCVRVFNASHFIFDGLRLINAEWHGMIGAGMVQGGRVTNIWAKNNGFRGVHFHGEITPVETLYDMVYDNITVEANGRICWQVAGQELNTGFFGVFNDMHRVRVGSLRAINETGIGLHLTGRSNGVPVCDQINVGSLQATDCAVGIGIFQGPTGLHVGSVQSKGRCIPIAGCTLGTGTQALPKYNPLGGYVSGALMQSILIPAGTDITQIKRGHGCYVHDISGGANLNVRLTVWSVDEANRLIWVYREGAITTRPWAVGADGTTQPIVIWTCRQTGLYLSTNAANSLTTDDISIASIDIEGAGHRAMSTDLTAGARTLRRARFASINVRDCHDGTTLNCFEDLWIGAYTATGCGNRRTGNDTATSGLTIGDGAGLVINKFTSISKGSGSWTRTNAGELLINATASRVKIFDITAENGNASNFSVQYYTNGTAPVMFGDPRNASGGWITPTAGGTGTNVVVQRYGHTS